MSYLGRKRGFDPLFVAGVTGTLLVHGTLLGIILWSRSAETRTAILAPRDVVVARIVRLGKKRPKNFLPKMAFAPPPTAPRAAVKLTRNENAAPARPPAVPPPQAVPGETFSKARARVHALAAAGAETDEPEGDPGGDPEGNSDTASPGDIYATEVYKIIKRAWTVSEGLVSDAELRRTKAEVRLRIDRDGRIQEHDFEKRSGNVHFDASIAEVLERVDKLPAPPPRLAAAILRGGLVLEFVGKDANR